MHVHIIPILSDNYSYIIEHSPGKALIVDPGESTPIMHFLQDHHLIPDCILLTHHHGDHIGGCHDLIKKYSIPTIHGPAADTPQLPFITSPLHNNDTIHIGGFQATIIETPGHTLHHICYWSGKDKILFCGDTLFALGCGRVFEGSMAQMHSSLQKLAQLPDQTAIYCGHEYTLSNGKFCLHVDSKNKALQKRISQEQDKRTAGQPTIPSTIEQEKATNVFLRAHNPEEFEKLRLMKDNFI